VPLTSEAEATTWVEANRAHRPRSRAFQPASPNRGLVRQVAESGEAAAIPHPDESAGRPAARSRQAPFDIAKAFDHGRDAELMLVRRGVELGQQRLDGVAWIGGASRHGNDEGDA
jgi:hypothetical protein